MWDGIIIGGGLAGLLSGIRASERGKRILIISEGVGSLTYSSGALDLGNVEHLLGSRKHPYALLGESVLRDGTTYFQRLFPDYQGKWGSTQSLLTPLGSLRSAGLLPRGLNAEALRSASKIVLIAPEGMKDFFPEIVKTNLERAYPLATVEIYPICIEAFESWHALGKSVTGMEYAEYWQSEPGLVAFKDLLNRLNQVIDCDLQKPIGNRKSVVVFPGLASAFSYSLKNVLSETPFSVVEMTGLPPSASGHTLYCALKQKFKASGGELLVGASVKKIELQGRFCDRVIVKSKGKDKTFSARSFVLATGGIFGGGIEVTPETAQEMVLGLPLYIPKEWTNTEFLGDQPYAHMGVDVDSNLRPIDSDSKQVILENIRIVGRMLAHWDPWYEHCGGGVSLASGWFAGEQM